MTRARKILVCACGGYQGYTLPGVVPSLLRHLADDVRVKRAAGVPRRGVTD